MPSVHIYCRVSSTGQEDGYSLDTQEARCRAWADEHGYPIASVAHEVRSGGDRHRPELDRMIDALGRGDVLLAYALDRFSRDMTDTAILIDRIERAGATLQLVTEEFEQSATGQFIRQAKTFAAQLELEKIRERTQRGRRARVDSGKPIVSPRPPYGYAWNADKSGYVLDRDTAPIVRMIFDAYNGGATLRGVCAMLEERGIPSPMGRPQWAAAAIRETIMRSIYSGTVTAYATHYDRLPGGGYARRDATPDERTMLAGIAPAIVTPEEHALAQSILGRNKAHATRNNRDPEATLLRAGFIRCGHCGWVMGVKNPPPSAPPGRSAAYKCNARGMRMHQCPQPTVAASVIDGAVWARVVDLLRRPGVIAEQLGKHRGDGGLDRDLAALDKRLADIGTKQTALARRLSLLSDDAAGPVIAELELLAKGKRTLEADRNALIRRMGDVAADAEKVRTLTDWCRHVGAKLDTATYDQKRQALEALGVGVRVYRTGATDADGNSLPRWQLFMRPLALGEPIVYGQT